MELTLLRRPQLSVHPIAMVGGEEAPGGAGADLGAPAAPTEVAEVLTQNKNPPKRWFYPKIPYCDIKKWELRTCGVFHPFTSTSEYPIGTRSVRRDRTVLGGGTKISEKIIKKKKKRLKKRGFGDISFLRPGGKRIGLGFIWGNERIDWRGMNATAHWGSRGSGGFGVKSNKNWDLFFVTSNRRRKENEKKK